MQVVNEGKIKSKSFFTILSISSCEDERNFMMRRIQRIKIFGSKSLGTIHVRIMQEESRLLSKQPVEKSKRSDAECCTQPISPTCRLLHAPMYENLLFEEAASSKYKNAALLKYSCVTRASNIYSFYDVSWIRKLQGPCASDFHLQVSLIAPTSMALGFLSL